MCFGMQDPTQEHETPKEPENTQDELPTEAQATDTNDNSTTEPEPELDPWEALELEASKWKDQAIRTAAELDNFRKRMAREKLDAVKYGNQSLLEQLLPVLDNFNMGMMAAEKEQGSMLYMGMDMVRKQIEEFFASQNVEEIKTEAGSEFDPNLHEALDQEESSEIDPGKVIRVMRKGYRIGDRLLRPSNVIISLDTEVSEIQEDQKESE